VPAVRRQDPVVTGMSIEYGLMTAPVGWTLSSGPPGCPPLLLLTYFLLVKPASTGRVTPVT
jgi:hypothetical protein